MKYLARVLIIVFFAISLAGCAGSSQTTRKKPKRKRTMINTTQLGKNKYFFSAKYQRKLSKAKRKKRR